MSCQDFLQIGKLHTIITCRCSAALVLLCLVSFSNALAQPDLEVKRVVVNWPSIELYFSVDCNAAPTWTMVPGDFRVYDSGREVTNFTMQCPNPFVRCPLSTALLFDASGSMTGMSGVQKQAGRLFIGQMDGTNDEAAVLWFNSSVTLRQGMTADTSLLNAAIDSIPTFGGTALWDGIWSGLQETAAHGSNSCRAVVAITDGNDNISTVLPSSIIAFANARHIRVFIIGFGTGLDPVPMEMIADLTGGRYYSVTTPSQLSPACLEIASIIQQGFLDCSIVYDAACADGALHEVELQLNQYCGGSDSETKSYRAMLDSATLTALPLQLGDVTTEGQIEFVIPLHMPAPLNGEILTPLHFDFCFNTNLLEFRGAEILPGALLDGVRLVAAPSSCGVQLQTLDRKPVTGSGELLRMKFRSLQSPGDTTTTELYARNAHFESGCLYPVIDTSTVTILPGHPILLCSMDAPRRILWDTTAAAYASSPFEVKLTVLNTGSVASTGGVCELSIDSTVFRRVSPTTAARSISDIPPGEFLEVAWLLDVLPQVQGDSSDVVMTAFFANHDSIDCRTRMFVSRSEPVLICEVQLPTLAADTLAMRYMPNPFPAVVTVRNIGNVPADNVQVAVEFPTEMSLAGADIGGPWVKPTIPASLQPGQSATVSWQLHHPLLRYPHSDTIRFHARADRGGTRSCHGVLDVPAVSGPLLAPRCAVPDSLHFESAINDYNPNPFTVELSCANIGTDTAYAVTGTLQLPAGLELDPKSQSLTKFLHTAPLGPWHIGDHVPEVSWIVRWTKRETKDATVAIGFAIGGQTRYGTQMEPVTSVCNLRIPGLRKTLVCNVDMIDSLRIDSGGDGLEPNPVSLRYRVHNAGQSDVRLTRVLLYLPPDGLVLDSSSRQGSNTQIDLTLQPGDSTSFEWIIRIQKRCDPRTVLITVVVVDGEGDPHACGPGLFIPGLPCDFECTLQADSVAADYGAQRYLPMPFTVMLTAKNNQVTLTDSLLARIILPPGALALAGADAGVFTKTLTPARLFPRQGGSVVWLLEHPLSPNEKHYTVRTQLWEVGGDTVYSEADVLIPAMEFPFWFTLTASGPVTFCEGGAVVLDAGYGYATYRWSTQDTTRTITVTRSGTYSCGVTLPNGLPGLSDNVTVIVHPLPPTPVITRAGDVLSTGPAARWQWYRDGVALAQSNVQTLKVDSTGAYQVRVTDGNGCEALSDPFGVSVLIVDEGHAVGQRFQLYPNPADGILSVEITLDRPASAVLVLRDLLGREHRRVTHDGVSRAITERIDLRGLRPGLYLLHLQAGTQVSTRKVLVR
jgi:hypothetical protein